MEVKRMRELHVSIVYHPPVGATAGTLLDLHLAKRPEANQNCIICRVAPNISDEAAVEKVRRYFLGELGRKSDEVALSLGHNSLKETPHREGESELHISADGAVKKTSVAA